MIIAHILMFIYTHFSAKQEASVVKAFIDYVPPVNKVSKTFHRAGAWMTTIVAILCSFSAGISYHSLLIFPSVLALYWLVFDAELDVALDFEWNYVGQTSEIDRLLWKVFGEHTEILAPILKILILFSTVIAYYIW